MFLWDLKNWPIFSFLDSNHVSKIHMALVYGKMSIFSTFIFILVTYFISYYYIRTIYVYEFMKYYVSLNR